jgi:ABC-2 type transport system permease protein
MPDVIAAEWLKLRTVRSTYVALGAALAFAGLGLLICWQAVAAWDGLPPGRRAVFRLGDIARLVSWLCCLCLAVLGVTAAGAEYRTGTIRTTFGVTPARRAVLIAKATVVAAIAVAAGTGVTILTFLGSRLIIGDRPLHGHRTAVAQELPGLLVHSALIVVYALLGLGLAILLRSSSAAIVAIVIPWYPLPILLSFLPDPWGDRITSLLPDALPSQIIGNGADTESVYGDVMSPATASAMMVAYAVLPLCVAAVALQRRDA